MKKEGEREAEEELVVVLSTV